MVFTGIERITTGELRALAGRDRLASQRNSGLRFANPTDSPLVFGLARMRAAFYDDGPWPPKLFASEQLTREWLGR